MLLALLFIILLAAIVVGTCYEMQVEASLVGGQSDQLQAYIAAKSAVASAMALLASPPQNAAPVDPHVEYDHQRKSAIRAWHG